ncbi:STAS-like domain-containing protein [Phenylobacterium sp. 20VBR1]|uniref:STAS-like domain-containing protein n=1 Tax=Phenylobacterium glaciei TaxID=2803784 RepID=A0A941HWN0_9CAUL|nr:STAS-like domain-containing protein [Phenylobacterium glaciei]MBR7619998.1 STAS-like domain-containing protein [Phenylobacterium glaciei]
MTLAAQMARTVTIDIAKDFSAEPFGRYAAHGPASGEVFRARLERYIRDGSHVLVDIDGVTGLSSSFLDEAFAGLVRHGVLSAADFWNVISIKSERDPSYIDDVEVYVSEAAPN